MMLVGDVARSAIGSARRALVASALVVLMSALAAVAPAKAAPTVPGRVVSPSLIECTRPGVEAAIACGYARASLWLDSLGLAGAVRNVVLIRPPAAAVWMSSSTPGTTCGYVDLGPLVPASAARYCGRTITVNHDRAREQGFARKLHATIVMAHETGHAIQEARGYNPVGRVNGPEVESNRVELDADCRAGAGMSWMVGTDLVEAGALENGIRFFRSLPKTYGHATPVQRAGSFRHGYIHGMRGCRRYLR